MILCVGQACYDVVLPIDKPLIENQKYRIYDSSSSIGAPACNASALLGKWNQDVAFIGRVGHDVAGKFIIKVLNELNVDTSSIYIDESFITPVSYIVVNEKNGSRTIFNLPGNLTPFEVNIHHKDVDVILLDGHELEASIQVINQYPDAIKMMDAGSYNAVTDELAYKVDYLVCSADFAGQCYDTKIESIEHAKQLFELLEDKYKTNVVLTLGDQGCLYRDTEIRHLKAYDVKAIDTTGAGDIYHGTFAYGLANHMKLEEICQFASAAAAISVTRKGAFTSIPELDEVIQFMASK